MIITYGTYFNNIDITEKFTHRFIQNDIVHIPLDVVFNDIFGDPVRGSLKNIYIKIPDKENTVIKENNKVDITIDLTKLRVITPKKINLVVIASRSKLYDQMIQTYWVPFIDYTKQHYENINIYLVFGSDANLDGLDCLTHLKDNIIISDKPDSLIPGVLDKTLYAFEYLKGSDYDFILRTNMSSFVMIDKLIEYVNTINSTDIYGGYLHIDASHTYVVGWNICMSRDVVSYTLNNREQLRMDISDDIALGKLLCKKYNVNATDDLRIEMGYPCTEKYVEKELTKNPKSYLCRIKNHYNRKLDIDFLRYLTKKFYTI